MSTLVRTGQIEWSRPLDSEESLLIEWCDANGIIDLSDALTWDLSVNFTRRDASVVKTADVVGAAVSPNVTVGFAVDWISDNLAVGLWTVKLKRIHIPTGADQFFRQGYWPMLEVTPAAS